jgi:hypothetical protein
MLISQTGFSGFNFVKNNFGGKNQISYLNIDAFLENQRTKSTVFKNKSYLKKYFEKENYTVNYSSRTPTISIELKDEEKIKNEFKDTIEFLKTKPDRLTLRSFMLKKTGLPILLCRFYIDAVNVLGFKNTIARLEASNTKKKIQELHNALIAFNVDKTDFIKRNILHDFPEGKTFTNSNEYEKQVEVTSLRIGSFESEKFSITKAKKLIKSFVEIKKTTSRNKDTTEAITHISILKVVSHNPMKFKKCKPKNILI